MGRRKKDRALNSPGMIKFNAYLEKLSDKDKALLSIDICAKCYISIYKLTMWRNGQARMHKLVAEKIEEITGQHFFEKDDPLIKAIPVIKSSLN